MSVSVPTWTNLSSPHRAMRTEQFDLILGSVAGAFAHHAAADFVSVSHVDDAYAAIAKCKLSRIPWYKTSEFFTSVGALCVGISISIANLLARLFPDQQWTQWPLCGSLFFLGAVVWLGGWQCRSKLPMPPTRRSRWKTCWPFFQCPHVDEHSQASISRGGRTPTLQPTPWR